ADVLLRDPGGVALDLEADVPLLEENRLPLAAQERVAEARLQAVPPRRQRAGHVADVLVVHEQHRAEPVRLHPLAGALQPVLPEPTPLDALLPVDADGAEMGHASVSSRVESAFVQLAGSIRRTQ